MAVEIDDSLARALEVLRDRLKRESEREDGLAVRLEIYALAGYSPAEVEARLGIDGPERRRVVGRLKRALRGMDSGH